MRILGVDIGTTSMKMAVFRLDGETLESERQFSQGYAANIYNGGLFGDIEPHKWKEAFIAGCRAMQDAIRDVEIISLSGTTPGLTAMDERGDALYPAILMLDQRSREQAVRIIDAIGLDRLLATTANMPVAGGCSLAGILWLKDHRPDLFRKTHKFGHSNTYFAHWLTGTYAIDPSSASLTALYNTVRNDYTWNEEIACAFDLPVDRLPELVPAYHSIGRVHAELARDLGLARKPQVLIGGNDAVLAAYSVGVRETGEVVNDSAGKIIEKSEEVGPVKESTTYADGTQTNKPMTGSGNMTQNIPEYPQADLWIEEIIDPYISRRLIRG